MRHGICPICLDKFYIQIKLDCDHNFCNQCLVDYVKERVEEKEIEILCPCEGCETEIDYGSIKDILSKDDEILEEYNKICIEIESRKSLNVSICNGCRNTCKKTSYNNYVYCHCCCEGYCFICKEQHDDYYNCPNKEEINNLIAEIKDIFGDVNVNHCPLCKIIVYKEEGCAASKCKYCKTQFCWECLRTQYQISKLKEHHCAGFQKYLDTESDDDYTSGSDLSEIEDN